MYIQTKNELSSSVPLKFIILGIHTRILTDRQTDRQTDANETITT